MSRTHFEYFDHVTTLISGVRETAPLVQCLTNSVTTSLVANVLLAVGASPAMVDIPDEAGEFAAIASTVLINLGTPASGQRDAMIEAATVARDTKTPWVLDPVGVGALSVRTALAHQLLALSPTVIRGNASEIRALAGEGASARGVDSVDEVDGAEAAARYLAHSTSAIVAVSGSVDLITDGTRVVRISNGSPLFTQITGAGCALGGVVAAFAASHDDPFIATVAACTAYAVAGEIAAKHAVRPGSFAVALLDELSSLTAASIADEARLS